MRTLTIIILSLIALFSIFGAYWIWKRDRKNKMLSNIKER